MQWLHEQLKGEEFEILAVSIDAPFGNGVIFNQVAGPMAWDASQNVALIRRLLGAEG